MATGTGARLLTNEDLNTLNTAKTETLGAMGYSADGRQYAYVSFGGTATINSGLIVTSPALSANSSGLAINTANTSTNLASGSTVLIVTNGTTAVTQDQFADGFAEILWSGGPFAVRINGNTAAASGGAITLLLADALTNSAALVAGTDTVNLTVGPYANVVPSLTQSNVVGVTTVQVLNTASVQNFGWVQVSGHCLITGTTVKGQSVKQATSGTAGFVAATAAATDFSIGVAKESATAAAAPVELTLH